MKDKSFSGARLFVSNPGPHNTVLNWHGSPKEEFYFYARSFRTAARTLVQTLELDSTARSDWDACPVVFLYRHAVELMMKAIITGDGGNFLPSDAKIDSIYQTHSIPQLLALIVQITEAVGPTESFACEGISSLEDFGMATYARSRQNCFATPRPSSAT